MLGETHNVVKSYSLRYWVICSLLGIPAIGITQLYGIGHVWLGVPLAQLWEPLAVMSIPMLLFGPLMYWAEKSATSDLVVLVKRRLLVVSLFFWVMLILEIRYSAKFGLIEADAAMAVYGISTIGSAVASWVAYQFARRFKTGTS